MSSLNLTFEAPIKENAFFNDEFLIRGTAISSTITDNNHKFLPEELSKAAGTMKGIPLLVDHDNRVDSIKGRVREGVFDDITQNLEFEAIVKDKAIQDKIKEGLLDSVSIGATVEDVTEEDGIFTPTGIKIRELSLVAVPADKNATFEVTSNNSSFQMALTEALKVAEPKLEVKSSLPDNGIINKVERRTVEMEQEKEMTELKTQLAAKEAKIAEFEARERKRLEERYLELCESKKVDAIDVTEASVELLELLTKQVTNIKEADVDEEPAKTPEEESKAEPVAVETTEPEATEEEDEESDDAEEISNYKIFQTTDADIMSGNAFTVEIPSLYSPNKNNYK